MKKSIIGFVVLMLAATILLLLFLRHSVKLADSKAAEIVPSDTVVMLQLTNLQRSRERWKETALYKIVHEPEMQAFLEKPRSQVPNRSQLEETVQRVRQLGAKELFLALTTITGATPKFVGGFDYKGKQEAAEAIVSELKARLRTAYPTGKSDMIKFESSEVETFVANDVMIASVFKDHWFFVSDDLDLLKATLGRLDGKIDPTTSLRDNADYKASLAKLPHNPDALCFVRAQPITDRLVSLITISNPNFNPGKFAAVKKIQAVSVGMKLEGEQVRDAIYVLMPGPGKQPTMARNSLAFTSTETLFYYASLFNVTTATPNLPDASLDATGTLGALHTLGGTLASQGLTRVDFKEAFGPEFGASMDWASGAMQPTPLFMLDVRDRAKAQKFLDALTSGQAGSTPWAKQEIAGVPFYSLPQLEAGFMAVVPVVALTDKMLLVGLSLDAVKSAIQQNKTDNHGLEKSGDFQAAGKLVGKPTGAFGYIDSKALFEKVYGVASNALKMLSLFNPHANDYADLGKLPTTETISKHLSPIVYSQFSDEDGLLMESAGPVTFNQAVFGIAAGAGFWAAPALIKQFQGVGTPTFSPSTFRPPPTPAPVAAPVAPTP